MSAVSVDVYDIIRLIDEVVAVNSLEIYIPRIGPEHVLKIFMIVIDARIQDRNDYLVVFGRLVSFPGASGVGRDCPSNIEAAGADAVALRIDRLRRIGLIVVAVICIVQRIVVARGLGVAVGLGAGYAAVPGETLYHLGGAVLVRTDQRDRQLVIKGDRVPDHEIVSQALLKYAELGACVLRCLRLIACDLHGVAVIGVYILKAPCGL